MKQFVKQYFQHSRRERNGIFLLLFVLLGLIVAKFTLPLWVTVDTSNQQHIEALRQLQAAPNSTKDSNTTQPNKPLKLVFFNPNTVTYNQLVGMGLTSTLAKQWVNYRQKAGPYKSGNDIKKLYNLTDSLYAVLEPFLVFPESKPARLEINTADSLQLMAIKDIGPVIAGRILRYRRQLGGYYTLDQLSEAFYINANTLEEKERRMAAIKVQLSVNPAHIKKININTASRQQLVAHPYISSKQAKAILNYTKANKIDGLQALKNIKGFTGQAVEILTPYLEF